MPIEIKKSKDNDTYTIELSDIPDITGDDPKWKMDVGKRYTQPQWLVEKLDNILVWMGLKYCGKEFPSSFFEMWGLQEDSIVTQYRIEKGQHAVEGIRVSERSASLFRTGAVNA
jgi:hypothetical protein